MVVLLTSISTWPPLAIAFAASIVLGALIGYAVFKEFWK